MISGATRLRNPTAAAVTAPSTSIKGKNVAITIFAAGRNSRPLRARVRQIIRPLKATPRAPAPAPRITLWRGDFARRRAGPSKKAQTKAGIARLMVLTPSTTSPPNPKKTACKRRATRNAGAAAHPRTKPIRPFSVRCTLLGPSGTENKDATKNTADRSAV